MNPSDMKAELLGVKDIMRIFDVGKNRAYRIIREINEKAKEENPKEVIICGKVNAIYIRPFLKKDE